MKLPASITFKAYLHGLGVVTLCADLTSTDPEKATVNSVCIGGPMGPESDVPAEQCDAARALATKALGMVVGTLRDADTRNALWLLEETEVRLVSSLSWFERRDASDVGRPLTDAARTERLGLSQGISARIASAVVDAAMERMQAAMAEEAERQAKEDCCCPAGGSHV